MATVKTVLERKGTHVETIGPEATALDAAHRMNNARIGSLVMLDGGSVVGIVTERDILTRIVAEERDPARTLVREIMSSDLATCTRATPLEACRETMISRRIRRLPVVEDGRLAGIITSGDVLRQEIEDNRNTIGLLNEYLEHPPVPPGAQA